MIRPGNYYEVLGIAPHASASQIKEAYRLLVRRHHPDANPDHYMRAEERMKAIMEAYATLSDPEKRARYDIDNRLREFETRFENPKTPAKSASAPGEMPRSLIAKVRVILGFEVHDFAGKLGLSDTALGQLEARDAVPQTPIQLRTFTNFCEQATRKIETEGQHSLAYEMRESLARKKSQRALWG